MTSGRLGKWAYALAKYDLVYQPLRAMKGQIVADFIVDHVMADGEEMRLVEIIPWKVFFNGLVCSKGNGVGCILVSPEVLMVDICIRLEFVCTNNQGEYESLLCRLDYLEDMGVKSAEAFGDSKLVVQQLNGDSQCLDGVLNCYRDKCLDRVKSWGYQIRDGLLPSHPHGRQ
jgi:hypothetical protein